jgi:ribonuclease P protein component
MVVKFCDYDADREENDLPSCNVRSGQSYPAFLRIRRRSEFSKVDKRGTRLICGRLLFQYMIDSKAKQLGLLPRLGITITRKQGDSVQRNRFKRCLREVFRRSDVKEFAGLLLSLRLIGPLPCAFEDIFQAFALFFSTLTKSSPQTE